MPLQSTGACPSCGAGMDMKKQNGAFTCPACGCVFQHNFKAWLIGIPLAVVVAYGVFLLVHVGLFAAIAGAFVAFGIVSRMGLYHVIKEGNPDVTEAEFVQSQPEKKEST
jgi:hypothetical protein